MFTRDSKICSKVHTPPIAGTLGENTSLGLIPLEYSWKFAMIHVSLLIFAML